MADSGATDTQPGHDRVSEESLLHEHLRRLADNRTNVFSVHIHLSELRAANRQPQFLRIAARLFETIVGSYEAVLFNLANSDMVLICRDVPIDEIDMALGKVRGLFPEDPLTAGDDGSLEDKLSTWFDLGETDQYNGFVAWVADQVAAASKQPPAKAKAPASDQSQGTALDPSNLAEIDRRLKETTIADLIRQQPAVRVHTLDKGEVLFREYYVSMGDLKNRVAPDIDLFGSRWLFQYLTETLDKRMLTVIGRRGFTEVAEPVSLNLNIGTVMSQDFQNFHRTVADNTDKVIIELQLINIFADISAYEYARDSLQERGYPVLVDGLSPLALQFFDPSLLRADYFKITWGAEFEEDDAAHRLDGMRAVIGNCGRDRVILARVDSEAAVRWGVGLGVTRFQGHFVDKLLAAVSHKKPA